MSDNQPKCSNCGQPRIAGHCLCRDCWEKWRAQALAQDPKLDAAKTDDKETRGMEFER